MLRLIPMKHGRKHNDKDELPAEVITARQENALEISRDANGVAQRSIAKKIIFYRENGSLEAANISGQPKKIEFRTVGTDLSLEHAVKLSSEIGSNATSAGGNEIIFRSTNPSDKIIFRKNSSTAIDAANKNAVSTDLRFQNAEAKPLKEEAQSSATDDRKGAKVLPFTSVKANSIPPFLFLSR